MAVLTLLERKQKVAALKAAVECKDEKEFERLLKATNHVSILLAIYDPDKQQNLAQYLCANGLAEQLLKLRDKLSRQPELFQNLCLRKDKQGQHVLHMLAKPTNTRKKVTFKINENQEQADPLPTEQNLVVLRMLIHAEPFANLNQGDYVPSSQTLAALLSPDQESQSVLTRLPNERRAQFVDHYQVYYTADLALYNSYVDANIDESVDAEEDGALANDDNINPALLNSLQRVWSDYPALTAYQLSVAFCRQFMSIEADHQDRNLKRAAKRQALVATSLVFEHIIAHTDAVPQTIRSHLLGRLLYDITGKASIQYCRTHNSNKKDYKRFLKKCANSRPEIFFHFLQNICYHTEAEERKEVESVIAEVLNWQDDNKTPLWRVLVKQLYGQRQPGPQWLPHPILYKAIDARVDAAVVNEKETSPSHQFAALLSDIKVFLRIKANKSNGIAEHFSPAKPNTLQHYLSSALRQQDAAALADVTDLLHSHQWADKISNMTFRHDKNVFHLMMENIQNPAVFHFAQQLLACLPAKQVSRGFLATDAHGNTPLHRWLRSSARTQQPSQEIEPSTTALLLLANARLTTLFPEILTKINNEGQSIIDLLCHPPYAEQSLLAILLQLRDCCEPNNAGLNQIESIDVPAIFSQHAAWLWPYCNHQTKAHILTRLLSSDYPVSEALIQRICADEDSNAYCKLLTQKLSQARLNVKLGIANVELLTSGRIVGADWLTVFDNIPANNLLQRHSSPPNYLLRSQHVKDETASYPYAYNCAMHFERCLKGLINIPGMYHLNDIDLDQSPTTTLSASHSQAQRLFLQAVIQCLTQPQAKHASILQCTIAKMQRDCLPKQATLHSHGDPIVNKSMASLKKVADAQKQYPDDLQLCLQQLCGKATEQLSTPITTQFDVADTARIAEATLARLQSCAEPNREKLASLLVESILTYERPKQFQVVQ